LFTDPRLKAYLQYLTLGSEIAVSAGGPIIIGYLLDRKFGTMPWITLAGVLTGMVLFFALIMRLVRKFDKKE
jgi:F0F1-type ATP synthase assembly protein I